jgi:hypothetical protein
VTAVDLNAVRDEFNRRCAPAERDPQKRADKQRAYWKRARDKWLGQYATEVRDGIELIWQLKSK